MDVTTMPSITSLLNQFNSDFPQFKFQPSSQARWQPEEMTIRYEHANTANATATLLHELAHALLHHQTYDRDIELISMERDAWDYALGILAPRYEINIDEEHIESSLDSYREWLHNRSLCPECSASGVQSAQYMYKCLACQTTWRVNEAKLCALRRYKISPL